MKSYTGTEKKKNKKKADVSSGSEVNKEQNENIEIKNLVTYGSKSKTRKQIHDMLTPILTEKVNERVKLSNIMTKLQGELDKLDITSSVKKKKILKKALRAYKIEYVNPDEVLEDIKKKINKGTFTFDDYYLLQSLMVSKKIRNEIKKNTELFQRFQECNSLAIEFMAGSLIQKSMNLYSNLNIRELLAKGFENNSDIRLSYPKLGRYFDNIQAVIPNSILMGKTPNQRTLILEHWIRIADKCLNNNPADLFNAHAIISAINDISIRNLTETNKGLSADAKEMRKKMEDIFSEDGNMAAYDKYVLALQEKHIDVIHTPLKFSKPFIMLGEGLPTGVSFNNYEKTYKLVNKVQDFIQRCQDTQPEKKYNPEGLLADNIKELQETKHNYRNGGVGFPLLFNENYESEDYRTLIETLPDYYRTDLKTKPYSHLKIEKSDSEEVRNKKESELEETRKKLAKNVMADYLINRSKKIEDKSKKLTEDKNKKIAAIESFYAKTSIEPINQGTDIVIHPEKKPKPEIQNNLIINRTENILFMNESPDSFKFNINKSDEEETRKELSLDDYAKWIYTNDLQEQLDFTDPKKLEHDPINQPRYMKALAAVWLMVNEKEDEKFFSFKESDDQKAINKAKNYADLSIIFIDSLNDADKLRFLNFLEKPVVKGDGKSKLYDEIIKNDALPSDLKDKVTASVSKIKLHLENLPQEKKSENPAIQVGSSANKLAQQFTQQGKKPRNKVKKMRRKTMDAFSKKLLQSKEVQDPEHQHSDPHSKKLNEAKQKEQEQQSGSEIDALPDKNPFTAINTLPVDSQKIEFELPNLASPSHPITETEIQTPSPEIPNDIPEPNLNEPVKELSHEVPLVGDNKTENPTNDEQNPIITSSEPDVEKGKPEIKPNTFLDKNQEATFDKLTNEMQNLQGSTDNIDDINDIDDIITTKDFDLPFKVKPDIEPLQDQPIDKPKPQPEDPAIVSLRNTVNILKTLNADFESMKNEYKKVLNLLQTPEPKNQSTRTRGEIYNNPKSYPPSTPRHPESNDSRVVTPHISNNKKV